MNGSSAFDAIDDPADPAWSGHAVALADRRAGRRRVLVRAAFGALLVVFAGSLVAILGGADGPAAPTESPSLVTPGAFVSVPQGGAAVAPPAAPAPAPESESPDAARPSASGWAPAQVTRPSFSPQHITGDASGVSAQLMSRLDALAADLGQPIEIVSGWRTRHEQTDLYRRYLAGTGNLAAVPGTSLHEVGRATDAYVDGAALATIPRAVELARLHGLHFPVAGEAWHVELIGDPQGSGRR